MSSIRSILAKPVLWAVAKFSSRPKRERVFAALSNLVQQIEEQPGKKGLVIPFEEATGKFIIFSDQHKGNRNGADDFAGCERNYLAALDYYAAHDFDFINLGDSEELWENSIWKVKKHNRATFAAEKKFLENNRMIKIFGNHDLYWNTSPWAYFHLKSLFGKSVPIYEGVILKTTVETIDDTTSNSLDIFLTHGHQGDGQSDGNWFSRFFVQYIWAPLQSLLRVNPNTPAYNTEKKTLHNTMMYEWSAARKQLMLITGHTHQPVFESLTHLERLYKQLQWAQQGNSEKETRQLLDEIITREKEFTSVAVDYMNMKPSYFNTGCCCFSDGDITGIEIANGSISLIKWSGQNSREILESRPLRELLSQLK